MTTTTTPRHADARSSDARAQFAAALAEKQALRVGYADPELLRLHEAFVAELRAGLKQLAPRARVKRDPAYDEYPSLEAAHLLRRLEKIGPAGAALGEEIYEKHRPFSQARADAIHEEHKRLNELLRELAPFAELRRAGAGGEWFYLDSRRAGDYGSQGYGALRYAEGSVQLTADVARAEGFVDGVDLVVVAAKDYDDVVIAAVRVESEVDAEIIRRCPPLSLREQVRRCWQRGVNPRVLNPFLPHGYEEKVGLDFFGGETKAAKTTGSTTTTGGVQ